MDHNDDGETLFDTFVDEVAIEHTYPPDLLTAAAPNVATTGAQHHYVPTSTDGSSMGALPSSYGARTTYTSAVTWVPR